MTGPPRFLRLTLVAVAFAGAAGAAPPATEAAAKAVPRDRALSPRLASVLAEKLPKYEAPKAALPAGARAAEADQPRNTIIRLPDYIVREKRPPNSQDILTVKGWEADAAKRYLGPKGNLDRTLNAVTLTDIWKSIPGLRRIPFVPFNSMNDGQRAQLIYGRIEEKRRFMEILDVEQTAQKLEKEKAPTAGSK